MGSKRAVNLLRKAMRPTMTNVGRGLTSTTTITTGQSLSAGDSGQLCLVSAAASVTLPAVQGGLYFKFVLSANITSATALVLNCAGTAKFGGFVLAADGSSTVESVQAQPSQNNTILTIGSAGNVVLAGSWVEVYCDGTNWLATGAVSGDSGDINTCSFSS